MCQLKPDAGQSSVIVYYDEKLASEAQNQASVRKCPARRTRLEMCMTTKLGVDGGRILPGVLHILPDHGKPGNSSSFKQLFWKALGSEGSGSATKAYDSAVFELSFGEESLRRRRRSLRHRLMEQSEKLLAFAAKMSSIPDRRRQFYIGTNRGKSWTNIVMEPSLCR